MATRGQFEIRRGQSVVEFALVVPVLILVVMGMFEGGRYFLVFHQASGCARICAKTASLWYQTSPENVVEAARSKALLSGASYFTIKIEIGNEDSEYTYDSRTGWNATPPLPFTQAGVPVKVTVRLPFDRLWQLPLFPTEAKSYEIRYSKGKPSRI